MKKCKDHGICTVEAILHMPLRELNGVKGLSDEKVGKMRAAGTCIDRSASLLFHTQCLLEVMKLLTIARGLSEFMISKMYPSKLA